jgi:trigger factor
MQVSLTHHTATRKSIELVLPVQEVNEEFGRVIAKISPQVRIPGFRPGKAPKDVIASRFAGDVLREVTENLVQRHFWNAAAAAGTAPISQPAVEKAELKEGTEGRIKAHFDIAPEVKLGDYQHLALTKKKRMIDDETLSEHLEGLRQAAAKFVPVEEPAAAGHYATLDIKVKPQGMKAQTFKDQVIELNPDRPFDKEILGLETDATRKFTLDIPAEDPNRAMAGKHVSYDVVLKDLRARAVPELNDEFAKDQGDYQDLEALKVFLRKDLEEAAERDALSRLQGAMLDALLETTHCEAPGSLLALQLDDYCNEFSQTVARQGIDPRRVNWGNYRQTRMNDAERAVKSGYILQAIGNVEQIDVTEEEIDQELRNLMVEHKVTQPFEALKADMEKRGGLTEIRGRIRTEKIFDRLLTTATVTEELLDRAAFLEVSELERRREAGIPITRFDAGGLEGGDLEDQEGGEPAAVAAAEAAVEPEEAVEAPKRAPRKPRKAAEEAPAPESAE